MNYLSLLYAFLFCGVVSGIGQIIYEYTKLTPGHITSIFVILGVLLESFHIYDYCLDIFQLGAMMPITNFGHSLAHAAIEGSKNEGLIGIFKGLLTSSSSVLTLVIVLGVIAAIFFKPKGE